MVDHAIADEAPAADDLMPYDNAHKILYLRLMDAEAEGADWSEVARVLLKRDPMAEPERARRCWETHLSRARWVAAHFYDQILGGNGRRDPA